MPDSSFVVCIDESGDQGFGPGSSEWFVLTAIVGLQPRASEMHSLVKDIKSSINWRINRHLHFKDIKENRRGCVIVRLIADRSLFRAISIIVCKPLLANPETFAEENRLYLYFTRYVLERASWLCRDSAEAREHKHGNGVARVIFSQMNEVSQERLASYCSKLQGLPTQIDWRFLRPEKFETMPPGKHAGLQIADSVAGSFYCPNHPCRKHKTERWAELLRPIMYRSRRGKYQGYGVKLCPQSLENDCAQDARTSWAHRLYPE